MNFSPGLAPKSLLRNKWLIRTCLLVLVYTLVGVFVAPVILKSQLETTLPDALHRRVTVQKVLLNPYVLSLRIVGFEIAENDGQPLASFDNLYVNLQLSSLFQWRWNVREVSLLKPRLMITLREGGKTNIDDLLNEPEAARESSKPPKINVEKLVINDGDFSFDDFTRTPTFRTRVHPIQLTLTQFSTNPDATSPYSFLAHTEAGGILSWVGTFSVNPLRSSGRVMISGLDLEAWSPYLADVAVFQVISGEMGLRGDYRLDGAASPMAFQIDHLSAEVRNLTLRDPETKETVVTLSSLAVNDAGFNLSEKALSLQSLSASDGTLLARRRRDGTINLLAPFTGRSHEPVTDSAPGPSHPSAATGTKGSSDATIGWRVSVKEITFDDIRLTAEDHVPPTPARVIVDELHAKVNGLVYPDRTPITTETSLRWNESGTLTAGGTLRHSPLSADIHVAFEKVDLRPFQPYLDELTTLQLTDGTAHADGRVVYGSPTPREPLVRFTGQFSLNHVTAVDPASSKPFVMWEKIALNGIHAALSPTSISIDGLRVNKLKTYLAVQQDGRSNISTLIRNETASSQVDREHTTRDRQASVTPNLSIKKSSSKTPPQCSPIARSSRTSPPNSGTSRGASQGYHRWTRPKPKWTLRENWMAMRHYRYPAGLIPSAMISLRIWISRSNRTTYRLFHPMQQGLRAIHCRKASSPPICITKSKDRS